MMTVRGHDYTADWRDERTPIYYGVSAALMRLWRTIERLVR